MAPFVVFPNGVQIELVFTLGGEIVSNRLWFWTDDYPPGSAELLGLADGVYSWYTSLILPSLSSELVLATVVAKDWSTPTTPFEVTTLPAIAGGVAEPSHSANVAISVGFRWPLDYGRLKRNKNYVPGIPYSAIDLNTPTMAIQNTLFLGYADLIDAARLFTPSFYWYWVVASQWLDGAVRSEQFFKKCIGPLPRARLVLGQRRRRLPIS